MLGRLKELMDTKQWIFGTLVPPHAYSHFSRSCMTPFNSQWVQPMSQLLTLEQLGGHPTHSNDCKWKIQRYSNLNFLKNIWLKDRWEEWLDIYTERGVGWDPSSLNHSPKGQNTQGWTRTHERIWELLSGLQHGMANTWVFFHALAGSNTYVEHAGLEPGYYNFKASQMAA